MNPDAPRHCGAFALDDGSICWRVWAPRADRVDLVLIDGDHRHEVAMTAEERGYFACAQAEAREGQRYAYRLNGGPERPDPMSLWQPDGVHHASALVLPERFTWSDQAWRSSERQDLVFYELHVGTFTPDGTFDAIIPRLEALRDLGITAIEVMPVAQFPGTRNWGYDGVHLFAVQNSYGGPHGLQRLVDACHAAGLATFMDVVYNHLGPEGNYLNDFAPYFSDRYHTDWGQTFNYDGPGCDAVRAYILDNVRLWLDSYHMDGLRLDAVNCIYDIGPKHLLREIKETADKVAARCGRHLHVIAESNLNDVRLLRPTDVGGYGLDGQWNDDFHHAVHSFLTGERQGYYADFGDAADFPHLLEQTFLLDGRYSRYRDRRHGAPAGDLPGDQFVIAIQNHDQVGNRARGDRLSTLLPAPAQRLATSMMLLAPYLPMLFMGEEYAEERPFLFFCSFLDAQLVENVRRGRREEFAHFAWQGEVPDPQAESTFDASRLSWSWPAGTHRAAMRSLYRDLLSARRSWPALKDYRHRAAHLLPGNMLQLIRGGTVHVPGETLRIEFNLTDRVVPATAAIQPWEKLLFSSEALRYDGSRSDAVPLDSIMPYECLVYGPNAWR